MGKIIIRVYIVYVICSYSFQSQLLTDSYCHIHQFILPFNLIVLQFQIEVVRTEDVFVLSSSIQGLIIIII